MLAQRELTEEQFKEYLLDSYMGFLRYFFELKNGKPFVLSEPVGQQSHFLTIVQQLGKVFDLDILRLIINVPPGYAKSTMLCYFIAWCIAKYPDSNFLYISYAFEVAESHTSLIKEIITMPSFRHYFNVEIKPDTKSRSAFKFNRDGQAFGCVRAYGSNGAVTGMNGGIPHLKRFSGMVLLDDPIQPDKGHSEVIREGVIQNYMETIKNRARGSNVPIVLIGQRVHEGDLSQWLLDGKDGDKWENIVLAGRDPAGNPLYPEFHGKLTKEEEENLDDVEKRKLINERAKTWLLNEQNFNRFSFWAQIMQRPVPDGGGIFEKTDFPILDFEPKILSSFITIDTASSTKDWADFTAMGFFGIYKLESRGVDTGLYALHWLDNREIKIEPKDLEAEFYDFWARCMRHPIKPTHCVIEKADAGVTLLSILKGMQGLKILDIQRTKASGSKVARYYEMQPYIARGQLSFTRGDRHVDKTIDHMIKITSNMAHAHDDTCDVAQTAIQCALIEGILLPKVSDPTDTIKALQDSFRQDRQMQQKAMRWDY
jgi:predicted phage terminase large subunit-like protein